MAGITQKKVKKRLLFENEKNASVQKDVAKIMKKLLKQE